MDQGGLSLCGVSGWREQIMCPLCVYVGQSKTARQDQTAMLKEKCNSLGSQLWSGHKSVMESRETGVVCWRKHC